MLGISNELTHDLKALPGIIHLRKMRFEKYFREHSKVNYFRGVYENFLEAAEDAPSSKPVGYNNGEAAKMYKERTERIYGTDYPVIFWMERYKEDIRSIFDFGGHIGVHFYSYAPYLDYSNLKEWKVCDVPEVLREAQRFDRYRADSILSFTDDVMESEGHDLFLANGSLQYLEWELGDKLAGLAKKPKLVIVNMLPLHKETRTITLQSIGTSFCPYYIRKEQDFVRNMESAGYTLVDQWDNEEKRCNIAFEPERSLDKYKGMVFIADMQ